MTISEPCQLVMLAFHVTCTLYTHILLSAGKRDTMTYILQGILKRQAITYYRFRLRRICDEKNNTWAKFPSTDFVLLRRSPFHQWFILNTLAHSVNVSWFCEPGRSILQLRNINSLRDWLLQMKYILLITKNINLYFILGKPINFLNFSSLHEVQ